jgi:hypothetical protein
MSHHPSDPRYVPTETIPGWPRKDYRGTAADGKVECCRCQKVEQAVHMEYHEYKFPNWPTERGWFHEWCWEETQADMYAKEALALFSRR